MIEAELAAACDRAHARWPALVFDQAAVAARVRALGVSEEALRNHGEDLILATACLCGAPAALALLDRVHVARVPLYVSGLGNSSDFQQEVAQKVRERLLLGSAPRLATYTARGPLGEWIRVVAVRTALNLSRSQRRAALAERLVAPSASTPRLDAQLLHARHREQFERATEAAFATLSAHERTLMRLHFVDGVGIDRLAVVYGVHRATAARWLVRLRRQMFDVVSDRLGATLGWKEGTVASMYRELRGTLQLSLTRLLGAAGSEGVRSLTRDG